MTSFNAIGNILCFLLFFGLGFYSEGPVDKLPLSLLAVVEPWGRQASEWVGPTLCSWSFGSGALWCQLGQGQGQSPRKQLFLIVVTTWDPALSTRKHKKAKSFCKNKAKPHTFFVTSKIYFTKKQIKYFFISWTVLIASIGAVRGKRGETAQFPGIWSHTKWLAHISSGCIFLLQGAVGHFSLINNILCDLEGGGFPGSSSINSATVTLVTHLPPWPPTWCR